MANYINNSDTTIKVGTPYVNDFKEIYSVDSYGNKIKDTFVIEKYGESIQVSHEIISIDSDYLDKIDLSKPINEHKELIPISPTKKIKNKFSLLLFKDKD